MCPNFPLSPFYAHSRPHVRGKFIFVGDEKLFIRGVTYGTFRPSEDEHQYPDPAAVERDFAQMAEAGINAVRTYTIPPRWLLDAALRHDLRVMVGLPWEQHIAFLDEKRRAKSITESVRTGVRACADHPAVLCFAVGNEIPASIVRWHGRRRVERFLKRLYLAAKAEAPDALVTYVNYPSTEYLHLPFLDFVCFNVYLEAQERLEDYLARLQNIAGDRPLVMAEIGLDSRRNGEEEQARSLGWQIRSAFAMGCAGTFIFQWTDEWYRGGFEVEDWDFGLTTRDRQPKPALAAVRSAYAEIPFPPAIEWPRISVVVCSYNGSSTIRDTLEALGRLEYPNYEVIVVNDGSTDATASIAEEYDFRVISTENRGLSSARNTGLEASTGEIVAYTDDDAYPDPHWLTYLAYTFMNTNHAGVGGPNIAPPGDGWIADCVANAPGGPVHVLLSDQVAEHIPGCNCAFRKSCLEAIGGWDTQFRTAGDDVDVCWRLQQMGWTLGFSPAAVVWHHRRNSLRTYWKQQIGYGRAEALLEKKWPEKYNAAGHVAWGGRLYGKGLTQMLTFRRGRIYQGLWGSAPFQSLDQPQPSAISSLPLMPEWYLIIIALTVLTSLDTPFIPDEVAVPLLAVAVSAPLIQACLSATRAAFTGQPETRWGLLKLHVVTAFLHLLQPLARLWGRQRYGLTPWRRQAKRGLSFPRRRNFSIWSENWKAPEAWLQSLETVLRIECVVRRGGDYDDWDLEVESGTMGAVRARMVVEEHGAGKQLVRFRCWPRHSTIRLLLIFFIGALSIGSALAGVWLASVILGTAVLLLTLRKYKERAIAMAAIFRVLGEMRQEALDQLTARPVEGVPLPGTALAYTGHNGNGNGNGRAKAAAATPADLLASEDSLRPRFRPEDSKPELVKSARA
jgi:O-antigen biosynthesis protein